MLAVIAGTGFYSLGKKIEESDFMTPYGPAGLQLVSLMGEQLIFLPRHGTRHRLPPHRINYRANVAALKKAGVTGVLAIYSSGAISKYKPGDIVLIDDFMALGPQGHPVTFYDDFSEGLRHTDFSEPFSKEMKAKLREVAGVEKVNLKSGGIVATVPGPRYETKSEIKALKKLGANLVNMTSAPEMTLLREAEIDFAAVAVVTNYAAGVSKTKKPINAQENLAVMKGVYGKLVALIGGFVEEIV